MNRAANICTFRRCNIETHILECFNWASLYIGAVAVCSVANRELEYSRDATRSWEVSADRAVVVNFIASEDISYHGDAINLYERRWVNFLADAVVM